MLSLLMSSFAIGRNSGKRLQNCCIHLLKCLCQDALSALTFVYKLVHSDYSLVLNSCPAVLDPTCVMFVLSFFLIMNSVGLVILPNSKFTIVFHI